MYKLASCEYEECPSKDTCKRYKNDSATINFKFYYNETKNKCEYYIEKELEMKTVNEEQKQEKVTEKSDKNGKSEQTSEQTE